ncbi:ATP-binding protein [bacterium]|nr:ATP-binding protein [bacterium]
MKSQHTSEFISDDPGFMIEQIFLPFRDTALRQLDSWYERAAGQCAALFDVIDNASKVLREREHADRVSPAVVAERFSAFQSFHAAWQTPDQDITQKGGFREAWQNALAVLDGLPGFVQIVLRPEDFDRRSGDNPEKRFARFRTRRIIQSGRWFHQIRSAVSKTIKKKAYEPFVPVRNARIDHFIRTFFLIPANTSLLNAWIEYNGFLGGLFKDLESYCDRAVSPDMHHEDQDHSEEEKPLITGSDQLRKEILRAGEEAAISMVQQLEAILEDAKIRLRVACTPLLPASRFSNRVVRKKRNRFGKQLNRAGSAWTMYWDGTRREWKKDIDLSAAGWSVVALCDEQAKETSGRLMTDIAGRLDRIAKAIQKESLILKRSGKNLNKVQKTALRQKTGRELCERAIPAVIDGMIDLGLDTLSVDIEKEFDEKLKLLDEEYTVFINKESGGVLPKIRFEAIPMRQIIGDYSAAVFKKRLDGIQDEVHSMALNLSNELSALAEVLYYAFDTADESGSHRKTGSREFTWAEAVLDGFQRTVTRIDSLKGELHDFGQFIESQILLAAVDFAESVNEYRQNERLFKLKLSVTRSRIRGRFKNLWRMLYRKLAFWTRIALRRLRRLLRRTNKSVITLFSKWLAATRLGKIRRAGQQGIISYLHETERYINTLPAIYQRLFCFTPVNTKKLFIGREEELAGFSDEVSHWKNSRRGMIAITGERGCGKTSFIQLAGSRAFDNLQVETVQCSSTLRNEDDLMNMLKVPLACTGCHTLKQMEDRILTFDAPMVCVLEDLHFLFLKTIESIQVLRQLLLFFKATESRILWIVTCSSYAWQFLDRAVRIAGFFQAVMQLSDFSSEDIKALVLNRHRLSGITLRFVPDVSVKQIKAYRKLNNAHKRQEWLMDHYFENLQKVSAGNLSAAMLFWLRSIQQKEKQFEVPATLSIDTDFLYDLSSDDQFVLTAIVQHGQLSIAEFREIFMESPDRARELLVGLKNRGLLFEKNGYYEIHFFLYKPLVRLLYERRFLH